MVLFKKKDDHPGSGLDKPEARGIIGKLVDKVKAATPSPAVIPPKRPATP